MLGKAAAAALAHLHRRKDTKEAFWYIKGAELQSKYVGEAEKDLIRLFEKAKSFRYNNGFPPVMFFDEADSMFCDRDAGAREWQKTFVSTFLSLLDGMEECNGLVVLATNRIEAIDPALLREGRMDRKIRIHRPTKDDFKNIIIKNLRDKPLYKDLSVAKVAEVLAARIFSDEMIIAKIRHERETHNFCLKHVVSGAMAAGIVEKAVSSAMTRDIKNNKVIGITQEDLYAAINITRGETQRSNNLKAMREYIATISSKGNNQGIATIPSEILFAPPDQQQQMQAGLTAGGREW